MSNNASFTPPSLLLSTIGLSLATFMQVLDTTIANVALPTISGNLGVSSEQGTWVITSFAVSNAIALPLTGWLSRRFGEVKLFLWATILFVLASFLCGISTSMPELIGFRVLQGLVAGPLYPMTQTLLIAVYPPAKRGMALALLAMVTVVAPIAGPILGGWITDSYSWPWIFFINVPIGIFAVMVVRSQLAKRPVVTSRQPMDYVGLISLIIGVGALQVILDKGNDLDWFESNFIIIGAAISVVALAVFVIWEMTDQHPVVNLRLFAHRNFRIGTIVLVLGYAGFFGINLILPQWLQTQMGYTATWAGLAVAPIGILPVLLSPFVGKYANKFDLRLLAGLAFLAIGLSCFMRAGFTNEVDFQHIALVQLFMGIGVALFFMPTLSILMSDLPPNQIADGAGLATFLRTLGGSFAASLTTWIWIRRADQHHAYMSESISTYEPTTREMLNSLGGASQPAYAHMDQILTSQAYMQSGEFDEARAQVDRENLLLWRRAPQRLEAEAIRDTMLAVSGRLDSTQFGPGSLDQNMTRRSVYFFIKRSQLIPMMMLFDWPEHLVSIGQRPVTTIAPQALMFMNSPQGRDYATTFAVRLPQASAEQSIPQAWRLAFGREPSDAESQASSQFLKRQQETHASAGHADAAQRALVDLCQTILSMNEFVYVE